MPLQKPSWSSISRSKRVRCSMRCTSTSFCSRLKELDALAQLRLDRLDGLQHRGARRHVVTGRKHREAAELLLACARSADRTPSDASISSSNRVMRTALSAFSAGNTSITSPRTRYTPRLKSISLRSYCISVRRRMISRWPIFSPCAQMQDHAVVIDRIADAVDRRHGAHDHHVAPLEQALGRRQAHLLDVLVDRRILLDEQVARRHVGLGLVVVVVGNEILDRVLRERTRGIPNTAAPPASCSAPAPGPDGPAGRSRWPWCRSCPNRSRRAGSGRTARPRCPRSAGESPRAGRLPAGRAGADATGCPETRPPAPSIHEFRPLNRLFILLMESRSQS